MTKLEGALLWIGGLAYAVWDAPMPWWTQMLLFPIVLLGLVVLVRLPRVLLSNKYDDKVWPWS